MANTEAKTDDLDNSSLENNGLERQQRLLSFLWPKTVPPLPKEDERLPYGEKSRSYIQGILLVDDSCDEPRIHKNITTGRLIHPN